MLKVFSLWLLSLLAAQASGIDNEGIVPGASDSPLLKTVANENQAYLPWNEQLKGYTLTTQRMPLGQEDFIGLARAWSNQLKETLYFGPVEVDFSNSSFSDDDLGILRSLLMLSTMTESIRVSNTQLTNNGVRALIHIISVGAVCINLKSLFLKGNKRVTQTALTELRNACGNGTFKISLITE